MVLRAPASESRTLEKRQAPSCLGGQRPSFFWRHKPLVKLRVSFPANDDSSGVGREVNDSALKKSADFCNATTSNIDPATGVGASK